MRFLLVYKDSTLDHRYRREGERQRYLDAAHDPVFSPLVSGHHAHRQAMARIEAVLRTLPVEVDRVLRGQAFADEPYDLVLAAGGDGTLLDAAAYVHRRPLLGVNTSPGTSVGHFCCCTAEELEPYLRDFSGGRVVVREYYRLRVILNGVPLERLVLNDVLYAHNHPAGMTSFTLERGGVTSQFKSSGMWIATAAGSTAGIRSAGGQELEAGSGSFEYLVREPYQGTAATMGILHTDERLHLLNRTFDTSLFIDGTRCTVPLEFGDRVEVGLTWERLRIVRKGP